MSAGGSGSRFGSVISQVTSRPGNHVTSGVSLHSRFGCHRARRFVFAIPRLLVSANPKCGSGGTCEIWGHREEAQRPLHETRRGAHGLCEAEVPEIAVRAGFPQTMFSLARTSI